MFRISALAIIVFLFVPSTFAQITRYVDGVAGSDTNDCSENPCATISYAIGQASSGDAIRIADGEYTEPNGLDITMSLTLDGESEVGTIIQANEQPIGAINRVITVDGEHEVEISDVTIRHGWAFSGAAFGGGLYSHGSTLTISNVTFSMNFASISGGGMFTENSDVVLTNVTFLGNQVIAGAPSYGGGGMDNRYSDATLTNVTFSNNQAAGSCGGMLNYAGSAALTGVTFNGNVAGEVGGGMCSDRHTEGESSPILTNVTFTGNTASVGGGMFVGTSDDVVLTEVIFSGNSAEAGGGISIGDSTNSVTLANTIFYENTALNGGGMQISGITGSATLTNVAFIGNVADVGGGGMVTCCGNSPSLTNGTFSDNVAFEGGGMRNLTGASPSLTNTIFWSNTADESGNEILNDNDSSVSLSYSLYGNGEGDIVEGGGFTAENSLTDDPLFVNPDNGNYRLQEGSPATDTGHPGTPEDIFVTDESGDPIDLDGNPRFFGDVIDIGAYENQGTIADEATPEEFAEGLTVPAPNPVRDIATLTVAVEESQSVIVEVFDVTGRRVQTLYDGSFASGTSETLTLDASRLSAGVYVVRATGEDFVKTRRVTVVR